jgi:hypothetical protein
MAKQNHIFRKIRTGSQAQKLADMLIVRPKSSDIRHMTTIADMVKHGMGMKMDCSACKHVEHLKGDDLIEAVGAETELSQISRECVACGSSAVSRFPS